MRLAFFSVARAVCPFFRCRGLMLLFRIFRNATSPRSRSHRPRCSTTPTTTRARATRSKKKSIRSKERRSTLRRPTYILTRRPNYILTRRPPIFTGPPSLQVKRVNIYVLTRVIDRQTVGKERRPQVALDVTLRGSRRNTTVATSRGVASL